MLSHRLEFLSTNIADEDRLVMDQRVILQRNFRSHDEFLWAFPGRCDIDDSGELDEGGRWGPNGEWIPGRWGANGEWIDGEGRWGP